MFFIIQGDTAFQKCTHAAQNTLAGHKLRTSGLSYVDVKTSCWFGCIYYTCVVNNNASTDKVKCNCHFLAPSRNCVTHWQALTVIVTKIIHTTVQLCLTSLVIVVCVDMVRYSVERRVFLYESYVKCGSTRNYWRKFWNKFLGITVPSTPSIHKLIHKVRSTGSLLDKNPVKKHCVLTEEKLVKIGVRLEHTPLKSLRCCAQETSILKLSAVKVTKLLSLRPYKATVVHALQPCDLASRSNLCNWFLQPVHGGEVDPHFTFLFSFFLIKSTPQSSLTSLEGVLVTE
jgi:hypothetical protein